MPYPKRRQLIDPFGLSFLDAMTCGFGAVVLFFMVIQSSVDERSDLETIDRRAEVDALEDEVLEAHENRVEVRNTLDEIERERLLTQGLSRRLLDTVEEIRRQLATFDADTLAKREHVERLQADLRSLDEANKRLSAQIPDVETPGDRSRAFIGDGDRQYLTGLKVGGERILILVDSSASMLADTVVNVLVRRNLPAKERRRAAKWRRAVSTVDWLTTQLPSTSHVQIITFAESAQSILPDTAGSWIESRDRRGLDRAMAALRQKAPEGGTSLRAAFASAATLSPRPDNIILLVDGLPTRGERAPRRGTISGKNRAKLFTRALDHLPAKTPINVILFPMEGDPIAPSAYWRLAMATGGSFLSPPEDWP